MSARGYLNMPAATTPPLMHARPRRIARCRSLTRLTRAGLSLAGSHTLGPPSEPLELVSTQFWTVLQVPHPVLESWYAPTAPSEMRLVLKSSPPDWASCNSYCHLVQDVETCTNHQHGSLDTPWGVRKRLATGLLALGTR